MLNMSTDNLMKQHYSKFMSGMDTYNQTSNMHLKDDND